MKRRTNQGGSVATFIVIGVILAVGLVGTVYLLNKRVQQTRSDQSISATSTSKNQNNSTSSKTSTTKTDTSKTPVSAPTQATNTPEIPTTGPELSVTELIGVYILTATVVAYIISRRKAVNYSL